MLVQSDHTRIFSRVSVGILGTLYGKRANLDPCKLVPPPFNIFGFLSTGQLYGTNKSRDTRTLRGIKCNALSSQYIATYRSTPTEEPTGRKVDSETSLQFRQCWRCFIKRIIRWCYVPMLRTCLCIVSSRRRPREHESVGCIVQACMLLICTVKWPHIIAITL